jgi:membrane protease YdiL (CAAX protease family)
VNRGAQLTVALALTTLVLGASIVRALLAPFGTSVSTAAFLTCLGAGWLMARRSCAPAAGWRLLPSVLVGVLAAVLLVAPLYAAGPPVRTVEGILPWGAGTASIALLEEAVVRGLLQSLWMGVAGVTGGVVMSAGVFAAMHVPIYGLSAMPVDLAVGLMLAGLRVLTGRVAPCAIAHVVADLSGWFWS